jgi:predicted transcriptional regulator of viral defense system
MISKSKLNTLKNRGPLTSKELQKYLKVSQPTISRLIKNCVLCKYGYRLYVHPDWSIPPDKADFAIACAKFGQSSAIGGLSALFHYGLLNQPPHQIWVIVPPEKVNHNDLYRTIRTKTSAKHGVDVFKFYRITNIERTILEALKFASKIGLHTAMTAARIALQRGLTSEKNLGELAEKLGLQSILKKHWEAIIT